MPGSDKNAQAAGQTVAIAAETLYLLNLLLLPGAAFVLLLGLYFVRGRKGPALSRNHLAQTVGVSLFGGALIVCVISTVLLLGGLDSGYTWVIVVLYFTFVHSSLILLGVLGLVKALNGERFRYPVLGRWFYA